MAVLGVDTAAAIDSLRFVLALDDDHVAFLRRARHDARLAALAFALGTYKFTRYRKAKERALKLVLPEGIDGNDLTRMAEGVTLARDLINTPTNDLGPAELEVAARELAKQHGAKFRSIVGDALLKQNFPLIHAVGRASVRAPRLIDLTWGNPRAPKVTLVGKGVCFDTGGLDIKPSGSMLMMKQDMGGSAAQSVVLMAIVIALTVIQFRFVEKKVQY